MENTESKRILCIDDEIEILNSYERFFRKDYQLTCASTLTEISEAIDSKTSFDIVICDFLMPEINGLEVLEKFRLNHRSTVRILISGNIEMTSLAEAINTNKIHKFILKPWEPNYLKLQILEAQKLHSQLEELEVLEAQAITDPVTGLSNHRYFQQKLETLFELCKKESKPLSVAMIDVDHFKSYNDRYGHPEGDRLLLSIGQRMTSHFKTPTIVSRYGGEEFAVIIPNKNAAEAKIELEEFRKQLEKNPFAGAYGKETYVTISVGVASLPEFNSTPRDLLEAADRALYESKHKGRNQTRVAYSPPGSQKI